MLLLVACSSGGVVQNYITGGPGQDIAVGIVDVEMELAPIDSEGTQQYTVHIEVTNMADVPLTVEQIRMSPSDSVGAFRIESSVRSFNDMIDPGKEQVFQMPLRGRIIRQFHDNERRVVEFKVIVSLTNGDTYEYFFEGPVRELRTV